MSHIYDALQKSKEGAAARPDKDAPAKPPRDGFGDGPAEPPEPPPVRRAPAGDFEPEGEVEGGLLGEPSTDFLRELDVLRENTEVLFSRNRRRVISFAAALPGEGTSTLAVHFAYLLARVAEKRVLLIDADMARSNLSLSESVGDCAGLTELLRGQGPLEKVILRTEQPHLHFLPAGRDRIRHVEAVSSGQIRPLFEELGGHYDVVVVDNAAVLEHPEAPLIGAASDGVVLVVRAQATRREIVQRALAELNFSRCRILGTVLNARKESLPGFLRERV
jgi:polysaccharide biosynthesis transport protein